MTEWVAIVNQWRGRLHCRRPDDWNVALCGADLRRVDPMPAGGYTRCQTCEAVAKRKGIA